MGALLGRIFHWQGNVVYIVGTPFSTSNRQWMEFLEFPGAIMRLGNGPMYGVRRSGYQRHIHDHMALFNGRDAQMTYFTSGFT